MFGRILFGFVMLFLFLPFIVTSCAQMMAASLAIGIFKTVADSAKPANEPFEGKYEVTNRFIGTYKNLKPSYEVIANFDNFNTYRRVKVTVVSPFDRVFTEDRPFDKSDPAGNNITIASWSQGIADRECEVILAIFAKKCAATVLTNSKKIRKKKGLRWVHVSFKLEFVQKIEFGDLSPEYSYTVQSVSNQLGSRLTGTEFTWEKAAAQRQKVYQNVAKVCKKTKRREGNCAIGSITLESVVKNSVVRTGFDGNIKFHFLKRGPKLGAVES